MRGTATVKRVEEAKKNEEGGPLVDTASVSKALKPLAEEVLEELPEGRRLPRKRDRFVAMIRRCMGAEDAEECEVPLDVDVDEALSLGDELERGWERRGNGPAWRRNVEVWKFAIQSAFRVLKARKLGKKEGKEQEASAAATEAAKFIRDGLLRLGPTFVKLGQVISTRSDVLSQEYIDVLKTLQDDVPGFSGKRAKEIVSKELGQPCDEIFEDFSEEPLSAASLGQVHTATYKGKKVAIKVQRAGLKELFDVDLKNLRKLAELLEAFDPKSDGADRDWLAIFEESKRLLYLEIDYLNEADNMLRFERDFQDVDWVRVPQNYREVSTPRILTMEFIPSLKLTDIPKLESLGLDRELLGRRVADAFLKQIVETGYFHCDPHPGNLCVNDQGQLVYYDFGMMDELRPNVREGFREFCVALFAGGPMIDDLELAQNARRLVDAVETMGVLAKGADRLAVEKLARFFMRSFKDVQLGKPAANIKQTIGADLTVLTNPDSQVFRFPPTFTFIFRSFASIDGIGKGLDDAFDIGKIAQPFIEKFTEAVRYAPNTSELGKNLQKFGKATGLNAMDVNTAITSPRRIAYLEQTVRSMEQGELKIRVRSLELEKQLERISLVQASTQNLLLTTSALTVGALQVGALRAVGLAAAAYFGLKTLASNAKVKKFDKTQKLYEPLKFEGE